MTENQSNCCCLITRRPARQLCCGAASLILGIMATSRFSFFLYDGNAAGAAIKPVSGVSEDRENRRENDQNWKKFGGKQTQIQTEGHVIGLSRGSAPFPPALASALS